MRNITNKEIRDFVRANYYSDRNTLWEPFEDYPKDQIAEWIQGDIYALHDFIKGEK